jgi:hypothetical protein
MLRRTLPGFLLAVAAVATLSACGTVVTDPGPTPAVTPKPTPTPAPGSTDNGTGGGGSDPGQGGGGIVIPGFPVDPNANPLLGDANYVSPGKDLANPHPINVQLVRAVVDADGVVTVDLRWYSGVAPCNQLDHVDIAKDDAARTVRLTVVEGSGKGDVMCIEIAELRATLVDLGKLASGTWTISAEGDAPAIPLEVP